MSELGQICRAVAKQVDGMSHPVIQISPSHTNDNEEWAKLYFMISQTLKQIEEKTKLKLSIDVVDRSQTECESSPIGMHEMIKVETKEIPNPILLCMHCSKVVHMTTRKPEEVDEYFAKKKFSRNNTSDINEPLPF